MCTQVLTHLMAAVLLWLRHLGFPNRIFDNSKSDYNKCGQGLNDNSDFKVKIVLSNFDFNLFSISFRLNSTKFDLFSITFWSLFDLFSIQFNQFSIKRFKKMTLMFIKRSKRSHLIEKVDRIHLFWSFLIEFDQIWSIYDLFLSSFDWFWIFWSNSGQN